MRRIENCQIESLENRRLMTAITWDGGAGDGKWSSALNWSTDTVPTAADDVTVNTTSIEFGDSATAKSLTVTAPFLTVSSGSLTVSDSMVIKSGAKMNFAAGTISGTATLTVEAGGAISQAGTLANAYTGDVRLPVINNYGRYSMAGGHDFGGVFHNYGTAVPVEGGYYFTRFINESTGTLYATYIPTSPGSPAEFGVTRDAAGVVSAVPFVNNGFVYTYGLGNGTSPGSGLATAYGQPIAIVLDATPTLGGKWQASQGPLIFTSLDPGHAAVTTLDSTFSLVDGVLTVRDADVTVRGIADHAGLRLDRLTGAPTIVTLAQPHTSLGLLQVLGGTLLKLGSGGKTLRTSEAAFVNNGALDLGDGLFIDENQPLYGIYSLPLTPAPAPATEPAYADALRGSIGGDVLTVNASNGASTNANKAIGYARGDGLASIYPSGTFAGEAFDSNDFVFRGTLRGDTDLDRDVDFSDLLTLARHYSQSTARGVSDGNVDDPANASGTVDFADLLALARNYGQTLAVPATAAETDRAARTARVATSVLS